MRSKPGKYGIKIWCLSCVKCLYICNLEIYTGKKGNRSEIGQGKRVVLQLIEPFTKKWREMTTDNFFTSLELAHELWLKQTLITGTVRLNKGDIPPSFTTCQNRDPKGSTLVAFRDQAMLTSFVDGKKKKPVVTLTTANIASVQTGKKPDVVLHYNATKGAVDAGDFITRKNNCVRKTRVWTKKVAMEMISIATLNASCLFKLRYPDFHKGDKRWRSEFLKQLSNELIHGNVVNRLRSRNISAKSRCLMEKFIAIPVEEYRTSCICQICNKQAGDNKCEICQKTSCLQHIEEKNLLFCKYCKLKHKKPSTVTVSDKKRRRCQKCKSDRKTASKCCCCQKPICYTCIHLQKYKVCPNCLT